MSDLEQADICAEVKDQWVDEKRYLRPHYDRLRRNLRFTILHKHYLDDDEGSLDKRRAKPKDPSLLNLVRHKAARIVKGLDHFEVHGVDHETDPLAAAYWKARLNLWAYNPANCVREVKARFVMTALAGAVGCTHWRFHPSAGPTLTAEDPTRITWHPGFLAPYDPWNPRVTVELRMTPDEITAMGRTTQLPDGTVIPGWTNTESVPTDPGDNESGAQTSGTRINWTGNTQGTGEGETKTAYVTVLIQYRRFEYQRKTSIGSEGTILPEGQRYMRCPNCQTDSLTQDQSGMAYPLEDPCPNCGAMAQRIDATMPSQESLYYTDGHRMIICAPFAGRTFYDGDWWYKSPSHLFPVDMWKPYFSMEPIPQSDTDYYKSLVLILDSLQRLAYEQMLRSRGLITAPKDGLEDYAGEPWQFSDHQDVAYYDSTTPGGGINYFQPPGMPPALPALMQIFQGVFSVNQGTGDLGMTQQQSKDIAVGTVRTLVETGEIPVDDHIAGAQAMFGRVLTTATEVFKSTDPPEVRLDVLGQSGMMQMMTVNPRDIPGVDIIVTDEPALSQEDLDAAQKLGPILSLPPPIRNVIGRASGVPESMLNELSAAEARMQAMIPPGMPGPGGPPGMPPPGMNGGGPMNPMAAFPGAVPG